MSPGEGAAGDLPGEPGGAEDVGAELTGPVRGPSPPGLGPNGLCEACRHQRLVRNTRGSAFSLCERSREDDRFPRYPRTPVAECGGFEPQG